MVPPHVALQSKRRISTVIQHFGTPELEASTRRRRRARCCGRARRRGGWGGLLVLHLLWQRPGWEIPIPWEGVGQEMDIHEPTNGQLLVCLTIHF